MKVPQRNCDHMIGQSEKWCLACWEPLIRAAVDQAKREVFEFLQHVEADGEIREFPEVRESLRQMIDAARTEARREEREACANLCRVSMYGASLATAPPSLEAMNFAQKWGEQVAATIATAILARDKEPRE